MPPVLSATMGSSLWGQAGNRGHGSWPTKAKANRHASRRLKSGRMPFICWNSRGATSKTSWQFSLQLNSSLGNFKVSLNHTYVQFLCSEELTSFYPDGAILPAVVFKCTRHYWSLLKIIFFNGCSPLLITKNMLTV